MGADGHHCVLTLVERKTRYVVIKKLSARTKEQACAALAQAIAELGGRVRTITLDNGTEFHDYECVERISGVKFYFATPYHSVGARYQREHPRVDQYLPQRQLHAPHHAGRLQLHCQ